MGNKKIAIATFVSNNFGTCLQAFALKRAIESLGYEVQVVVKKNEQSFNSAKDKRLNSKLKLFFSHSPITLYRLFKARKYWALNSAKFKQFIDEEISPEKLTVAEAKMHMYQLAVTGSDMVWSPDFFEFSEFYFLRWIDSSKRIAYAPSFGTTNIDNLMKSRYTRYLKEMAKISCREKSGCDFIKWVSGRSSALVCDPTLLFSKENWTSMLNVKAYLGEYILVNCFEGLNSVDEKSLRKLEEQTGLNTHYLNVGINETLNEAKYRYDGYGPHEFLSLASGGAFHIVNGYHGLLFALIFNKPFVVLHRYGNAHWGKHEQRMSDLLDYLNLSDRYISKISEIKDWHLRLNYSAINEKMDAFRKQSWDYLSNSLNEKND